jgi:hypothetical protein
MGGGQQQQQAQQPIQIFTGGQPGMAGGVDQNAQMNAILEMLMQRGLIPRGTNEQGAVIPAGQAGSVFGTIAALTKRRSQIKSSLGLPYTPDNIIDEYAYRYPKGLPSGPEGDLIRMQLQKREGLHKQRRLAADAQRAAEAKEALEQTPEAMQRRSAGQSTTRGGGGTFPGARPLQ